MLLSAVLAGAAWSAPSADSQAKIVNTSQGAGPAAPRDLKPNKPIIKVKPAAIPTCVYPFARPAIMKVKPELACAFPGGAQWVDCIVPGPEVGQWDVSAGVLFARLRGKVAWPRYPWWGWGGWWGAQDDTDFTDGIQLPAHLVVPTWSVTYQFRPTWAVRYSGLAFEANGGGQPSGFVRFGPQQQFGFGFGFNQNIQSKYQHAYHRVGLLYSALRTGRSTVKVFADWVHAEDKMAVGCPSCLTGSVLSKGTDAAITGIEIQKCLKTTSNGATFSWDCKAGAIFLDDVEGYDIQGGAQYTIPLNSGRSGYLKGGYRVVELKKTQNDYLLKNSVDGGFMEFGFIF